MISDSTRGDKSPNGSDVVVGDSDFLNRKIRHRTSVVCIHDGKLLTFFAIDPTSKKEYLFLPGGMIEPGEASAVCGERETLEETGYRVRVEASSEVETHYEFGWDGRVIHCHTFFYRAELAQAYVAPTPVKDADYNMGVVWLPLAEIREKLNYHPVILNAVETLAVHSAKKSLTR